MITSPSDYAQLLNSVGITISPTKIQTTESNDEDGLESFNNFLKTNGTTSFSEKYFNVDLNSRLINVPYSYLGVEGDIKAETIYFRVSNYFDNQKLSGTTTDDESLPKILIQYTNANGDTGISWIDSVMQIENDENELLIIPWTLPNKVTKYDGIVSFVLSFVKYSIIKISTQTEASYEEYLANPSAYTFSITYSLNTRPATFSIYSGMNLFNEESSEELDDNEYATAIGEIQEIQTNLTQILEGNIYKPISYYYSPLSDEYEEWKEANIETLDEDESANIQEFLATLNGQTVYEKVRAFQLESPAVKYNLDAYFIEASSEDTNTYSGTLLDENGDVQVDSSGEPIIKAFVKNTDKYGSDSVTIHSGVNYYLQEDYSFVGYDAISTLTTSNYTNYYLKTSYIGFEIDEDNNSLVWTPVSYKVPWANINGYPKINSKQLTGDITLSLSDIPIDEDGTSGSTLLSRIEALETKVKQLLGE